METELATVKNPIRAALLTLALLGLLLLSGLSSITQAASPPRVSLSADPASISVKAGTAATSTITVKSRGFTGSLSLTAAVSSEGLSATLEPANVTLVSDGTSTSTLTIITTMHTILGNYTVNVTGTSSEILHPVPRTAVSVTVTTPSDFTMSVFPSSVATQLGRTAYSNITIEALNFDGSITLAAVVSPRGPVAVLTPDGIFLEGNATATSEIAITVPCSAVPGEYSVVVTGQWGPLVRSLGVTLTILDLLDPAECPPDFTLTPDRQDLTVTAGQTGAFFVTLRGVNNFTGNVTLDATVDPSGPQTLLARTSVALETVTVASVQVMIQATSAYLGTFSVTVIAVSGDTTHSASIQATIIPAAENPPPQTSPPPGGGTEANYPVALIVLVAVNVALAGATLWAVVSLIRNRRQQPPVR